MKRTLFKPVFTCLVVILALTGCVVSQKAGTDPHSNAVSSESNPLSCESQSSTQVTTSSLPAINRPSRPSQPSQPVLSNEIIEWPKTSLSYTFRLYSLDDDNVIIRYAYELENEKRMLLVRYNHITGETVHVYDVLCSDASLQIVKGNGNRFAVCCEYGYMLFSDDKLIETVSNDSMYWCKVSNDFKYLIYAEKSENGSGGYVLTERESGQVLYTFENRVNSAIPVFSEDGRLAMIKLLHNNVSLNLYDINNEKLSTYSINTGLPEALEYCELIFENDNKVYFMLDDAVSYIYSINLADNTLTQVARVQNTAYENGVVQNFVFNGTEYAYVKPTAYPLKDLYVVRYNAQTGNLISEFDARGLGGISDICYLSGGDLLIMFSDGKIKTLHANEK